MKRKVIQVADSTALVSLPMKWVKQFNIKKGDELDVEMDNDKLIVQATGSPKTKSIVLDVSGRLPLIEKIIGAIYRAGYDDVFLSYSSNKELEKIHSVVGNNVIGFEIVDEKSSKIHIKSVSSIDVNEFETMLRRGFRFLLSMADDAYLCLKEEKYDELRAVAMRDNNINKISDFCRRILNMHGKRNYNFSTTVYVVAMGIERLGDYYKTLAQYCADNKIKPSKDLLSVYRDTNKIVEDFYECFYKFNLDSVDKIMTEKKRLVELSDSLIEKSPKKDVKILNTLSSVASFTSDMTGVLMVNFL